MEIASESTKPFKVCTLCGKTWSQRDEFLSDPELHLIGYQTNLDELALGLLYFNHEREGCYTTLALEAGAFMDLYTGPVFRERKHKTANCPGHCLHIHDLEPCPMQCECASVRALLKIITNWSGGG